MYQTLLTTRYLTSRVIPLIAVAAVALCVALVIVVVSVMSGFLDMVQSAGRTLMGDVIVSYGISGIPHYEEFASKLEQDSNIKGASPIIDGWGLLRMPYPDSDAKQSETVQVWGIEPESFARVTQFDSSLQWKTTSSNQLNWLLVDVITKHSDSLFESMDVEEREKYIALVDDASHMLTYQSFDLWGALESVVGEDTWKEILSLDDRLSDPNAVLQQGLKLSRDGRAAIVSGLHVSDGNKRQKDGTYRVLRNDYWWLPRFDATLTMLPIDSQGGIIEPESIIMPFANEFQSGVFIIDESRIFVPLKVTQRLLHLDAAEIVDTDDPTIILGVDPARATSVLIRGNDGVTAEQLRVIVNGIYDDFRAGLPSDTLVLPPPRSDPGLTINTWQEQQRSFTGPVEKERELMRTLFSIVYFVVAALILSIFWSIVYEKTKDIGILRSIGASRSGIVWIFLQYSLVIGVAGALLGLLIGWSITHNINAIHTSMGNPPTLLAVGAFVVAGCFALHTISKCKTGRLLPIVLGSIGFVVFCFVGGLVVYIKHIGGLVMWDASVYYFSTIPNSIDWASSIFTMTGAVVFCLLGAIIPAAKAADTDPVEALRHE